MPSIYGRIRGQCEARAIVATASLAVALILLRQQACVNAALHFRGAACARLPTPLRFYAIAPEAKNCPALLKGGAVFLLKWVSQKSRRHHGNGRYCPKSFNYPRGPPGGASQPSPPHTATYLAPNCCPLPRPPPPP